MDRKHGHAVSIIECFEAGSTSSVSKQEVRGVPCAIHASHGIGQSWRQPDAAVFIFARDLLA
jgi:hypothetical protein